MQNNLSVVVSNQRETTVMTVSGELDLASTPQLADALDRVLPVGETRMILDLAELDFIDLTGLRLLLRAQDRARRDGVELVLVNVQAEVRRLMMLTGAAELLNAIDRG